MSNDKVAATFSGQAYDDPVVKLAIEAAEKRGYACGLADGKYHQRPTTEDWAAARRWSSSYGFATQVQETTGEHTKAKLEDNPYGGVTGNQAIAAGAFALSQMAQHTGSAIPGVPQNQYLRDMAKEPAPVRVSYIPLLGWPVTRGPAKPFEWYLGASVIVAILILFTFVRIFYIG